MEYSLLQIYFQQLKDKSAEQTDNLIELKDSEHENNFQDVKDALHVLFEQVTEQFANAEVVAKLCAVSGHILRRECSVLMSIEKELSWFISALNHNPSLAMDILEAIDLFLTRNTGSLSPETSQIILDSNGAILSLRDSIHQKLVHQIVIKTLQCTIDPEIIIKFLLCKQTSNEVILVGLRVLLSCLESQSAAMDKNYSKKLLSVTWRYMCYDQQESSGEIVPEIQPTTFSLPIQVPDSKPSLAKKKSVFHSSFEDLMAHADLPPTGDEQWDSSRTVQSCIRHSSISLLILIIREINPTTMFEYWPYFVFPGCPSLRHIIRSDNSWRVRLIALIALEELITSARAFLAFAEKPRTTITAFTTFSETLGATLLKLHEDFISLLNNISLPIVIHVVRCLGALVSCTPYQRISIELLSSVIQAIRPVFARTNKSLRSFLLTLLSCIVKLDVYIKNDISWICEIVLDIFKYDNSVSLQIECLRLLSDMSTQYFYLLNEHIEDIQNILNTALNFNNPEVQMQAGRTTEVIGQALYQHCESNKGTAKSLPESQSCLFYDDLIHSIVALAQNEYHTQLRLTGCDCLGSIEASVFQSLPRNAQILVITVLFSSTRDVENTVRGAAIRALTRGILEAGRKEDFGLVADIAEACIVLMGDSPQFVQIKAAWSISNLTDALLLNRNESTDEELPDNFYLRLFEIAAKADKYSDKVKSNIIRAMGNLLRLITKEQVEQDTFLQCIKQLIAILVKFLSSGRDMKIKWNSCYALSKLLKNEIICDYNKTKLLVDIVFPALLKLTIDCSNFKVRTNASLALSSPTKRRYYGAHWNSIWCGLIQVLESSQHVDDFKEYKHRDMFTDQVCMTLAHLVTISNKNDYISGNEILYVHEQIVKSCVWKCQEQLVPEKVVIFSMAVQKIKTFLDSDVTDKQAWHFNKLLSIFMKEC